MDAWLERTGYPRGALISYEQMWALAQRWYDGRLSSSWRGRRVEEAQAIVDSVGLTGDFWQLT